MVAPRPQHLAQLRARLGLLNVEDDKLARLDASFAAAGLEPDLAHLVSPARLVDRVEPGLGVVG